MAVRPDVRYDDAPLQTASCQSCHAIVQARKSSWEQTSIQWTAEAMDSCLERRASTPGPGTNGRTFRGCTAMRDSLREAAVRGDLEVVSHEDMPTNPEAHTEEVSTV